MSLPYIPQSIAPAITVTHGDCKFATYLWRTKAPYKGRIIFIHGYRDSQEIYYWAFEQLMAAGYDVFYFDQRGEGNTVLTDGSKGTTDDEKAFEGVDFFVEYNLKQLKQESKPSNLAFLTVSMGGGIGLNYAAIGKHIDKIFAEVNIAPLVLLHEKTYPGIVVEWISRILCCIPFCKTIKVKTEVKPEYISADPAVVEYLEEKSKEPLYGTVIEARDFIQRGRRLLTPEYYEKVDKNLPILICHGDDDKVNDYEGSREFIEKVNGVPGMKNKQLIVYPGGQHVLLADAKPIRDKCMKDLLAFLAKYEVK